MSSSPPTEARPGRWNPAGWPLRTRLIAIMIVLLALLGLVVGATAEVYLHNTLYQRLDSQVQETANRAQNRPGRDFPGDGQFRGGDFLQKPPPGAQTDSIFLDLTEAGEVSGGGIVALSPDANGIYDNEFESLTAATVAQLSAVTPNDQPVDVDLGTLGDYRVLSRLTNDGGVVVAALPLADTQETLLAVALVTGGAVLVTLVVAGWAGAVIIRRTLQPLHRVAATATRVSELELDRGEVDLAQRVPAADTDPRTEVGAVGAALNRLLDHVGNALEARHASEMQVRQFVADASHELRTPLTQLHTRAQLLQLDLRSGAAGADITADVDRLVTGTRHLGEVVEDLLLSSQLGHRDDAREPVDLGAVAADVVAGQADRARAQEVELALLPDAGGPSVVSGHEAALRRVLTALVDNALSHTPAGGHVSVGLGTDHAMVTVVVRDDGTGFDPADTERLFARFARGGHGDNRRFGLGLALAREVVTGHGGSIEAWGRPGQGAAFTIRLPAADR